MKRQRILDPILKREFCSMRRAMPQWPDRGASTQVAVLFYESTNLAIQVLESNKKYISRSTIRDTSMLRHQPES